VPVIYIWSCRFSKLGKLSPIKALSGLIRR
jgi:hypothetical protein